MAELELSVLSRQCLNRRIPSQEILKSEIMAWQQTRNEQKATVSWRFTNDNARLKLRRLYPLISPSSDEKEHLTQPICELAIRLQPLSEAYRIGRSPSKLMW